MYVVFGATGQTGSAVANTLLEKQLTVRVVLRSNKSATDWQSKGAEVALADLRETQAMTAAMLGADAIYAMNPPALRVGNMFAAARDIGAAYVTAVKDSGAEKVVLLSSVGSQHSTGTGLIFSTHILERDFSDLEVPVTFLRAASFMDNYKEVAAVAAEKGILPSFYAPLDRKIPMVAAKDIGRAAAGAMTEDWMGKRIVELHGASDYSPNDVAAAFAVAIGRDVRAVAVPESQWQATVSAFGFSPKAVDNYIEMIRGINSGHIVFENNGTEVRRGRTTIEEFAAETVKEQNLI